MQNYNYWSQDTSESIEHHGILGQKWGVRRFQNEDGSLTAAGQERYLSNKTYAQKHDVTLGTGNKMYRISTNPDAEDAPRIYTALTKSDANAYKGLYSRDLYNAFKVNKVYQKTYEVSKNTSIASEERCKNIMADTIKSNSKFKNAALKTLQDEKKDTTFRFKPREIDSAIKEVENGTLSTSAFNILSTTIVKADPYGFQKTYFNKLAKNGYDGLMDINNKYIQTKYHSTAPAIIFNTNKLKLSSIEEYDPRNISKFYAQEFAKQQVRALSENGNKLINYINKTSEQGY